MRDLIEVLHPILNPVMSEMGLLESDWKDLVSSSTDTSFADVAMPCHSLSKFLRKSPLDIADDVLDKLGDSASEI